MTTRKEKARRAILFEKNNGLITIEDVARLLGVRVVTARGYKNLSIIEPYTTNGRQDLYDIDEIKWTLRRLRALKPNKSLREISHIIYEERRDRRKATPTEYEGSLDTYIIP